MLAFGAVSEGWTLKPSFDWVAAVIVSCWVPDVGSAPNVDPVGAGELADAVRTGLPTTVSL